MHEVFAVRVADSVVALLCRSPDQMPCPVRPARDARIANYLAIHMRLEKKSGHIAPVITVVTKRKAKSVLLAFFERAEEINRCVGVGGLRVSGGKLRHKRDSNNGNSHLQTHVLSVENLWRESRRNYGSWLLSVATAASLKHFLRAFNRGDS